MQDSRVGVDQVGLIDSSSSFNGMISTVCICDHLDDCQYILLEVLVVYYCSRLCHIQIVGGCRRNCEANRID